MADPEGEILTLDEVAAYLKAGKRTVYRLAAEGKLPAFKLGGTWRFRRTELQHHSCVAFVCHGALTAIRRSRPGFCAGGASSSRVNSSNFSASRLKKV